MFVSRLVAALFVLITGALVAIFTIISDPSAGATRLPAELDLKPIELAAEPFDSLSDDYLAAGESDPQDFSEVMQATRDLMTSEIMSLIDTDLKIDLPEEQIAELTALAVEETFGLKDAKALHNELVRGIPTEEMTELETARLAANPAPAATTVLTLSDEERRVIAFGDQVADFAIAALLNLQSEDGPLAKALKEADKIEQVTGISARPTRTARVAVRTIELETYVPVNPTPASTEVERRTDVRARTGSTVAEILVKRGDDVSAGDVLMRLDADDRPARRAQALASIAQGEAGILQAEANVRAADAGLESAQAQVTQAQTSLQDAEDAYADTQTLVEGGARSANALRDAKVRVNQAEQSLLVAQSGLAQAEASLAQAQASLATSEASLLSAQANLDQIDIDIARLTITAPFDGRIEQRFVEIGDAVNPSESVVRLAELGTIKVTAQVADDLRQVLTLGQSVEVKIGADETPHMGEITFIGSTSGDLTRTFEVQVTLDNVTDEAGLFAFADNQFATAYFTAPERMVYRVPQSSLSSASVGTDSKGGTGLRTVNSDNVVVFIPLEQSDFAEQGDLLIDSSRLPEAGPLRLIIGRAGFVEIGDTVNAREELQADESQ